MIIEKLFSPIYGKYCWNASKGYGSFLTFEFGEPHLVVTERIRTNDGHREMQRRVNVHGDWHLWIYLCGLEIYKHDQLQATSPSSTRIIARAMNHLNGQGLVNAVIHPDSATTFTFELGDRLETIPNIKEYGSDSEQWLLFEPSGKVFTLRADHQYSFQPGDVPEANVSWQELIP